MSGFLKIKRSFVIVLFVFYSSAVIAQETKERADTSSFYKNIQNYSGKHKITWFFYRLLFHPVLLTKEVKEVKKKEYLKAPFKNLSVHLRGGSFGI